MAKKLRAPKTVLMFPMIMMVKLLARLGYHQVVVRQFGKMLNSPKLKGKSFRGYELVPQDVIVATFAKSGTNWMMQIAQQIAYYGAAEFEHIHHLVAWPDSPATVGIVPLTDPTIYEKSPTGLKIIKTHNETKYVPYNEKATYLTVIRDPKEVLVSGYYFLGKILGVLDYLTMDEWFDIYFTEAGFGYLWAEHTAGFWDWRHRANVLVLTYPQMKRDPEGCIQQVADIMGVTLTEAQFKQVVERSSFAYMKAHNFQFGPPKMPFVDNQGIMIRSGKTGATQESLSREQQAKVDQFQMERLAALGSDFPYRKFFEVVEL